MGKLYKLTKQDGTTYEGYFYGEVGKVHKKPAKKNPKLCSSDVFHGYKNKNLAFLLNPIHANISNPVLWEIEGDIVCSDFGKIGSFEQIVVGKLEYPSWVGTDKEKSVRAMFAILCAESVLHIYENKYAGDERVRNSIDSAKEYLKNPANPTYAAVYTVYAALSAANAYAATNAALSAANLDFGKLADKAVDMIFNK